MSDLSLLRGVRRGVFLLLIFSQILVHGVRAQGWRHVVEFQGQRGSALGGGVGDTLYAGLNSGEVFRSDDNGVTWTRITQGLVDDAGRMLVPKAFVVTPSGRVIRGGDNASWQNKAGSPIFVSDDRGARWTEIPLPFASSARNPAGIGVSDLVVHQGAIYFSDVLSEGVWKSVDDGRTWAASGTDLPTVPFIGFAKTYYAVASAGGALLTVEATRGVHRSIDGGQTWTQSVKGIPGVANSPLVGGRTWTGHDIVGAADGTAFAVVDSRLYRSRDAGASWEEVGAGLIVSPNPFVPTVIQPAVRKVELLGDRVYVTSTDGNPRFFEGTALGDSWAELPRIAVGGEQASILSQSFAAYQDALYAVGTNGIHRLDLGAAVRTPLLPVVETRPAGPFGVNEGGTLQIQSMVRGTAPFTYEWRLGGELLAGQSGPLLNYTPGPGSVGGELRLVVRNAAGSVTNILGPVSVAPVAVGVVDYAFRPQNPGGAGVSTMAFGPDGSVYYGGVFTSPTEMYTGVRKAGWDGTIDTAFVTGAVIGAGSGPGAGSGTPTFILPMGDGSVLVGASGTYYRRLRADGSVDTSWPVPAEASNSPRKLLRLADGKYLVGGAGAGGVFRLNADGTLDRTFQGPTSLGRVQRNYVNDLAELPDGRILMAGYFNDVDGVPRVGLARLLPGGALDRSWVPAALPTGSEVKVITVLPEAKILFGGAFVTVGGQPHRNLARLHADGTLDDSLGDLIPNTTPAGVVNALAQQPDGRVWVGGAFRGVAGRSSLFRLNLDGTVDTTFPDLELRQNSDATPVPVMSLALTADGRLWIGSNGGQAGGHTVGQLFRIRTDLEGPTLAYGGWDQTPDLGSAVVLRGAVSGPFTSVQWRFQGVAVPGGTALEHFLPSVSLADSGRYDLVVVSAGGSHTSAPVQVRVRGGVVIDQPPVAGVGLVSGSANFAVSAFGRLPLSYQWLQNGAVLVGATHRSLTLTNLSLDSAGDYTVRVTGGDGSVAVSEPAYLSVIRVPGTLDAGFRVGLFKTTTFTVFKDLEFLPDGRVVVCGNFATSVGGPNAGLARLTSDGAVDPTFQFDPSGATEFLGVERQADGRLVVLVRHSLGYEVRRLLEDGTLDPSFNGPDLEASLDLQVAPDGGILVLGMQGVTRLDATGAVDVAFGQRAQLRGPAQSLSIDDQGGIYVTGQFSAAGELPGAQMVRLHSDGTRDLLFAPTNVFSSQWTVTAVTGGALVGDLNGFRRLDSRGRLDSEYAWGSPLAVWDLTVGGGLVGVLPTTTGDGVLRRADGTGADPVSTMKVPVSFNGYSFLRVAPEGAFWVALGGNGLPADPTNMLYKLQGTVTPLALVSAPLSQTVESGAPVTFTAAATGTSQVRYQWRRNSVALVGETNAALVIAAARISDRGDYTVVVSNRSGSLESRPATLVVLGAPEILALRGGGALGLGDSLSLSVSVRGVGPITFQWRRQGISLPGATHDHLSVRAVAATDAGAYEVVVTNPLGSTTSSVVLVSVLRQPGAVIGSFTGGSAGAGRELNVLPSGDFLVDDKAYTRFGELRFRLSFPDGTSTVLRDRIAVDPAQQRIYAGPTRRVRAYDMEGSLLADYAGPAANVRLVRVEAAGTVLQSTEGAPQPFQRLAATGAIDPGFAPAARPGLDALPLPDGTTLVLSFGQTTVGGRVVYHTLLDRLLPQGALDPAFGRVTNVFAAGGQATRMARDRNGRILILGGTGTAETNRIVRLHADGTRDDTFVSPRINGEVTAVVEQHNGRLVIVGAFTQVDAQPRSLIARLRGDGSPDDTFQPGTGLTRTSGQNVAYDVDLLPTGEIVVTGTFTHANGQPRNGVALLVGDSQDLYFTREPSDVVLALGGTAELVASGTGTSPVSYQWFKDGSALAGRTSPSLNLGPATAATEGAYHVVLRNGAGESTSRVARVRVVVPPEIIAQPVSQVVDAGGLATFEVGADGLQLLYQWRLNGTPIPAATNAAWVVPSASALSAGTYAVEVRNSAGTVVSSVAQLRVRPAPAPAGGPPFEGIVGEYLFAGNFLERSNRFVTLPKGTPTLVEGFDGGQAARFRSGTDWLQMGTGTARLGGTAYSASFWIWPEERGSINVYSLTLFLGTAGREHYLYLGGDDDTVGGQRVFLATRGLNSVHSSDDRAYVPNLMGRWTHVVVAYQGNGPSQASNFTVYIDGVAIPLVNSSNPIAGTGGGNGLGRYGPTAAFRLDDFRLYNRALSMEDVARLQRPGPRLEKPAILRQPAGGSATLGDSFQLSVEAMGEGLFYEWYRGATLLAEADGPVLRLTRITAADAGDYRVVVSNPGGSTTSATVPVVVGGGISPFAQWALAAGLAGDQALPGADADGDGVPNAAEFLHGTSPTRPGERPKLKGATVTVHGVPYAAVDFVRRQQTGTLRLEVRVADEVLFLHPEAGEEVSATPLDNGLERVVWRAPWPVASRPGVFFRFEISD
ncbi:MAG: hypothetical protein IT580_24345 [Verrucomicrobiales bacterium]|nr:hypothetical protein [Verrucomicrobiales bacterium]